MMTKNFFEQDLNRKLQQMRLKLYDSYVNRDLLEVRKAYQECIRIIRNLEIEKPKWLQSIEKYYTFSQLHNIPAEFVFSPVKDQIEIKYTRSE